MTGGLLVGLAVLGMLTAGRRQGDESGARYVVARRSLPPGTRLAPDDLATVAADLPADVAGRVFADPAGLTGAVTLAPLAPNELLQAGSVLPRSSDRTDAVPAHEFSFRIERARALDGALQAGERVDLLATYGIDTGGYTTEIAGAALVLQVAERTGDLTAPDTVVLTVALPDMTSVLAVAHAAATDAVTVVRAADGHDEQAPSSYQPPGPGPTLAAEP